VLLAGGDDLVHQRIDRRAAAIDDALSADLENRRIRKNPKVRRSVHRSQKLRVGQRALGKKRLKLRGRRCHGDNPSVSNTVIGAGGSLRPLPTGSQWSATKARLSRHRTMPGQDSLFHNP
jgi:hypothetical protein